MTKYNPKIHNRKSIRLKGYDYSKAGLYFVTICCQNRTHFFGEIKNGELFLNDAGKMICKWYAALESKFPDIKCHEMIVMPNHFHCIIEITDSTVGIDQCVNPNDEPNSVLDEHAGSSLRVGSSLHQIIQWFKTMTTNEYIRGVKNHHWRRFDKKLWQRNYWEHIIRNDESYDRISNYIKNNPKNWEKDKLKM